MPELVTNVEIEDVLSSIRRLVSEDTSDKNAPEDDAPGRFVLTPAHRIEDDEDYGHAAQFADEEVSEDETATIDERSSDDAVLLFTHAETAEPRTSLEDRIVELESAVGQAEDEWEPDGSEPDAGEMPKQHIFASRRASEPAAEAYELLGDVAADEQAEEADIDDFAADDIADQNLPFIESSEAEMPVSEPVAELDVHDTLEQAAADPVSSETEALGHLRDEQILDEAALRELIATIVSEELQGVLGERITRNVRRMVRREIQRAVALKEFD